MSNYEEIKALVKRISGQDSVISIQRVYLDIFGDLHDAAVLSQCVFWSDKGRHEQGWFYKSLPEWRAEIGIKRSALETAIEHLEAAGVVEKKVMAGKHNSPTMHYRVDMDNLTAIVVKHLQETLTSTAVRPVESSISKQKPTDGRSAGSNIPDLLNSTDRPAESSISSYSSLHSRLGAVTENGLSDPIWDVALEHLKQTMNGTFAPANPRLMAIDENPHRYTVLVESNVPGLKRTIEQAVEQAVRALKKRRKIVVLLVTDWPGYTPARRVKEIKPVTGSKVQAALADILSEE